MGVPYGGRTKEEYEELLKAKLEMSNIRLTLEFAALFLLAHELIKYLVIEKVLGHYGEVRSLGLKASAAQKALYATEVLALDVDEHGNRPKKPNAFRESAQWLINAGALDAEKVTVLDEIFRHRSDLAHELTLYLIDVDVSPNPLLLGRVNEILISLHRFWAQMEIDMGTSEEYGPSLPGRAAAVAR